MRSCQFAEAGQWQNLDGIINDLAVNIPVFAAIREAAPSADLRMAGQKIPRQSHRYSGRTAMHAHKDVNEPQPPTDTDSALAFSMEGFTGQPPASLITHFWSPGWNSEQSVNKFQDDVGGPLRGG